MQAVRLNRDGMILFSTISIPEAIRAELVADHEAVILDDVTPPEIPERGGYLCVSVDDPKHFVVVELRDQAKALGCLPTGKPYGVIHSVKAWKKFLSTLNGFMAIASRTDETDTDEAWDSVMANLRRVD
jgi:hypothetical protein